MANDINELRSHLFDVLRGVKDGSVETETARTVCAVASEITKTAHVELKYMAQFDGCKNSTFINPALESKKMTTEEVKRIKGGHPLL